MSRKFQQGNARINEDGQDDEFSLYINFPRRNVLAGYLAPVIHITWVRWELEMRGDQEEGEGDVGS